MILSKTETLSAVGKMFILLSEGKSEHEVADELGIDLELVKALQTQMYEVKTEELKGRPVEHTFVEYMIRQMANIHDLTEIINELKSTKQYNQTTVGAIRARAEIWDKIMAKGQECSVIKKAPERKEVGVVQLVAELSNTELRKEIAASMSKLVSMVERHGETDFMKLPAPKELHVGPSVEIDESDKKKKEGKKKKSKKKMKKGAKSKTSRVSKGRIRDLPPNPLDKKKEK